MIAQLKDMDLTNFFNQTYKDFPMAPPTRMACCLLGKCRNSRCCKIGLLGSLVCLVAVAHAMQSEVDLHVVEPTSGVKFPVTVPGEKSSMYLMGTAIRVKKIVFVSVQVYAVGLYVDKSSVSKLPGQVSATLFDVLLADETNIPLTLRMQMVRDVGGETMSGALKEAIEPRLAKIHNNDAKTAADMTAFTSKFDMASLAKGTVLTFHKTAGGALVVEVGGVSKGDIKSKQLCRAFFSVFLGDESVVERDTLVERLSLLR